MFESRQLNNPISKIHERALRLVYKDNKLTFNEILELDNSVTTHQRNLQILPREIFKVLLELKEPDYNLRLEASHFKREIVRSTHYRIQSVKHLGQKIWNIVPQRNPVH